MFPTCVGRFDEVHDDRVCSFSVDGDLIRQRVSNHNRHAFPGGVEAKCVQQLKAQLPQVWQFYSHLVREASDKGALVGPGGVDQCSLVGRLCLISEFTLLQVPRLPVVAGRNGAKGALQASGRLLLVQFGERAVCRGGGQHAGPSLVGGAVGDEAGGAAVIGARGQSAGGEAFDEVLDGLNWGLQLKPHPDLEDKETRCQSHQQQQEAEKTCKKNMQLQTSLLFLISLILSLFSFMLLGGSDFKKGKHKDSSILHQNCFVCDHFCHFLKRQSKMHTHFML